MTFSFTVDARLLSLIEHGRANFQKQKQTYTGGGWGGAEKALAEPSLMLVKDSGVYVMSPFTREEFKADRSLRLWEGDALCVIYAEGHGADTFIGGDDFSELIPIPDGLVVGDELKIKLTATQMQVLVRSKAKPAAKVAAKQFRLGDYVKPCEPYRSAVKSGGTLWGQVVARKGAHDPVKPCVRWSTGPAMVIPSLVLELMTEEEISAHPIALYPGDTLLGGAK